MVLKCITDNSSSLNELWEGPPLHPGQEAHILTLRGMLACGLLVHALQVSGAGQQAACAWALKAAWHALDDAEAP
jgi:hypothetical protein